MNKFCRDKDCLIPVTPEDVEWARYVTWAVEYIGENWKSVDHDDYDRELRQRFSQGNRFCFFLCCNQDPVGLANLYTEGEVLHIAEYTIRPNQRGKGLGSRFIDVVVEWAKTQKLREISAEVDLDQEMSNRFWHKQGWQLDKTSLRNRYWRSL